jgi:hypothetical protein
LVVIVKFEGDAVKFHTAKYLVLSLLFVQICFPRDLRCMQDNEPVLQRIAQSLEQLQGKLSGLESKLRGFISGGTKQVPKLTELKTDGVTYRVQKDGEQWRIPIRFIPKKMREDSIFNAGSVQKDNCKVVGGSFTYYDALPVEGSMDVVPDENTPFGKAKKNWNVNGTKDVHNDRSWGCAWRASLNVLNSVKEWLAEKHNIIAGDDYKDRYLNMYDIQKWGGDINYHNWIEPHDNAELYLVFLEKCYSLEDQIEINKLLGFRCMLFLRTSTKDSFLNDIVRRSKDDSMHSERLEQLFSLRKFYNLYADNISYLNTPEDGGFAKDEMMKAVLEKVYSEVYQVKSLSVENFRTFDSEKAPFPINFDDKTYANNIFGIHTDGEKIKHFFKGDTHVYGSDSPWGLSGWKTEHEIFEYKNIKREAMIFQVYLKQQAGNK